MCCFFLLLVAPYDIPVDFTIRMKLASLTGNVTEVDVVPIVTKVSTDFTNVENSLCY